MADRQLEDINQSGELSTIKLRTAAATARLLTEAEIDAKITTADLLLQTRDERGIASGYAPLDATGKVPAINLPPSASVPHHVYSTQALMLAGGPDHSQGEMILVTTDPTPAFNGEYIALIDAPVLITDYDHLGASVSPHRHTGVDVDVTPKIGGGTETLQAFVDTSVTKWTELIDTPASIQAFQLVTGNLDGSAIAQDPNLMAFDGHLTALGDNLIITSEPNILSPTRAEIDIDSSALLHQITMNVLADGQPTLSFSMATNSGFIVSGQTDAFIDGNVGSLITRGYLDGHSKFGTGLEKITEGGNSGWRLVGADTANYGDIGDSAIDFSIAPTASSSEGATGPHSFATGFYTTADGDSATAIGRTTKASGIASFVGGRGSSTSNALSASGVGTFHFQYTTAGGPFDAAADRSVVLGGLNNQTTAAALRSVVLGGTDQTATLSDTVYLDKLKFKPEPADATGLPADAAGYVYYNSTTNELKLWNGTALVTIQTA